LERGYDAMPELDLSKLRRGMTRREVVSEFGEPDLKGGISRKYPEPCVYRYGNIEFMFEQLSSGVLEMVQEVDKFGGHVRWLYSIHQPNVSDDFDR